MKKFKSIFTGVSLALIILSSQILLAQTCTNDPDDPGNCDTLWIEQENGRIPPNTTVIRHVWAYHDEVLAAFAIPLKYKNPQTDVFLDSTKLTFPYGFCYDTVINRSAGTILLFALCDGGVPFLPPGTDTLAILYFRTGPTWDPTVSNPLDTFTIGGPGGQGLSFVDTATNDIQPVYDPPGDLEVGDDPRPQSAKSKSFSLSQNYPNPFNTETVITFTLPKTTDIRIEIFNILGQKVKDLVNERVSSGYKSVVWDGKDNDGNMVTSGIYFYRIMADNFVDVRKMALLK